MILKELSISENKIEFIKEHKSEILKEKRKLAVKHSDGIPTNTYESETTTKAESDGGILKVEVVANLTNFMDSHYDVLMPGAYNKTINDNKTFPYLKNHQHNTDGIVGNTTKVYTKDMLFNGKKAEALIFVADIMPNYDRKTYELYKSGGINQHSIGLKYVKIDLALNDPEEENEYKLWQETIEKVINKEGAEEVGFYFVVREIKLFENSAVLFGSNSMTPTLNVEAQKSQPQVSTPNTKASNYFLIQSKLK